MTLTALPATPATVEPRRLPDFVGPAPSDIELAEAELIATGLHFTVVDIHPAAACPAATADQHIPIAA